MRTCIEVPKGTAIGSVVSRLTMEDTAAARLLFTELLFKQGVPTDKVGVRYLSAVASAKCESAQSSSRYLKTEPRVDGDQADTIGLLFKFNVVGNALDVATATDAVDHFTYERTDAVIFRSPVWLNYGSAAELHSTRKRVVLCNSVVGATLMCDGRLLNGLLAQCATPLAALAWMIPRTLV